VFPSICLKFSHKTFPKVSTTYASCNKREIDGQIIQRRRAGGQRRKRFKMARRRGKQKPR